MLVTANILRNTLTITNNLTMPFNRRGGYRYR